MMKTLLVAMFALMLIACGSGSSSDVTINVKAQNNRFLPERIEIPAGRTVTLTLQNLDEADHDLEVKGLSAKITSGGGHGDHGGPSSQATSDTLVVHSKGKKSASVTFVAERSGTYEVVCTQPGHKEVGMVGTFVVSGNTPASTTEPSHSSVPAPASTVAPDTTTHSPMMQPPGQGGHEGH